VNYHLVVREPFGPYKKGDMITAADEVALVLDGPQHTHVIKRAATANEAPAAPQDHD